jgi:hypothetical protein
MIVLNIGASSGLIERYFSICGIVNDRRRQSMSDDLLISRSLLKANMFTFDV